MFKLVIMRGGLETGQVVLEAKRISIGRDQTSDITLDDASVSRHHARLIRVMDSYYLEDLDSTNGTQRNHRPITKHVLKHSDEIRIGGFTLYFIAEEEAGQRESDASPEPPTAAASATEINKPACRGSGYRQLATAQDRPVAFLPRTQYRPYRDSRPRALHDR